MEIKSYRDLEVWQKAIDLVVDAYHLTSTFPKDEKYGLTSQIRRASVSVPSNIAEGHSRGYTNEYLHHIAIAQGSLAELETQLEIALRLNYIKHSRLGELLAKTSEIGRILTGLKKSLK